MARNRRKLLLTAAALVAATAARCEEAAKPVCYSTAQTRTEIAEHKLGEPFALMRAAAQRLDGEAIGVRLCRSGEDFVYEVSVLKRDGRVMKTLIDAASGRPSPAGSPR